MAKTVDGKHKLILEVCSVGKRDHISSRAYDAVVRSFGLDPSTAEVDLHEPEEA